MEKFLREIFCSNFGEVFFRFKSFGPPVAATKGNTCKITSIYCNCGCYFSVFSLNIAMTERLLKRAVTLLKLQQQQEEVKKRRQNRNTTKTRKIFMLISSFLQFFLVFFSFQFLIISTCFFPSLQSSNNNIPCAFFKIRRVEIYY